jgi:hypothetical protein
MASPFGWVRMRNKGYSGLLTVGTYYVVDVDIEVAAGSIINAHWSLNLAVQPNQKEGAGVRKSLKQNSINNSE